MGLLLFLVFALASAKTLQFYAHYPQASVKTFQLRGDGCGLSWNAGKDMNQTSQNVWLINLDCNQEVKLETKVMHNGNTWQIGSNTIIDLTQLTDGQRVDVYPWFFTYQGSWGVAIKNLYSPQLNNTRSLVIYTPPSYNENTLKTINNLLIMQDGQNLFDPSTSYAGVAWMCQDTVNSLVNQGLMDEIVIVGVYNTADRIDEYTYSVDPDYGGGKGDIYLDFLEQTVIPWVLPRYRVNSQKTNLGIMGSSLGALISCYAGWTRSNVYGKAGCMSTSFWWNNEDFNNVILVNYSNPVPIEYALYLDSGGCTPEGDDMQQTMDVRDHIETFPQYTLNQNLFYYWDKCAQHSEYYWGKRFYIPMEDMYPIPTIKPYAMSLSSSPSSSPSPSSPSVAIL